MKVFDRVFGAVVEELSDQAKALMVGDMSGGLLLERSAIEVVREVGLDDRGSDCCRDAEGIEGHGCGRQQRDTSKIWFRGRRSH